MKDRYVEKVEDHEDFDIVTAIIKVCLAFVFDYMKEEGLEWDEAGPVQPRFNSIVHHNTTEYTVRYGIEVWNSDWNEKYYSVYKQVCLRVEHLPSEEQVEITGASLQNKEGVEEIELYDKYKGVLPF